MLHVSNDLSLGVSDVYVHNALWIWGSFTVIFILWHISLFIVFTALFCSFSGFFTITWLSSSPHHHSYPLSSSTSYTLGPVVMLTHASSRGRECQFPSFTIPLHLHNYFFQHLPFIIYLWLNTLPPEMISITMTTDIIIIMVTLTIYQVKQSSWSITSPCNRCTIMQVITTSQSWYRTLRKAVMNSGSDVHFRFLISLNHFWLSPISLHTF